MIIKKEKKKFSSSNVNRFRINWQTLSAFPFMTDISRIILWEIHPVLVQDLLSPIQVASAFWTAQLASFKIHLTFFVVLRYTPNILNGSSSSLEFFGILRDCWRLSALAVDSFEFFLATCSTSALALTRFCIQYSKFPAWNRTFVWYFLSRSNCFCLFAFSLHLIFLWGLKMLGDS